MLFFKEITYLREYVITFDDKQSKVTHWILLFIEQTTAVYFDSFGIEYILEEVVKKIKDKSTTYNIFRIQSNGCIMCGFCCIAFKECMTAGKTLLDYTNLLSPNENKKSGKIMYKYFKDKYGKRKCKS